MAKLTIETLALTNPTWSSLTIKPGDEVTMSVDAPGIKGDQHIEFRIQSATELIEVVIGADGAKTAKWKSLNLPYNPSIKFTALLKEKPSPKNGHRAVAAKIESPAAQMQSFAVAINTVDAAFVPKQEHLQLAYLVVDAGAAAKKGRFEIWGERYPTDKPLYTENFVPAAGVTTWQTWDGKANAGPLNGKYITPEFSPYRVRVTIGADQASVDDPLGAGLGKVSVAERQFEVTFLSVFIRVETGLVEAAAQPQYQLASALAIEPRAANGTYAATGRLPTSDPAEVGRIRIPMACHYRIPDSLDQGGIRVTGNYMSGGGLTKFAIDNTFYTRPKIPIEFELRLRSRIAGNNNKPQLGLFEKEAVGPAKIEPFAEDVFLSTVYSGAGVNQTYWRNAACKIKRGSHNAPQNSANLPVFSYWQARFEVGADGDQDFDISTFDPTMKFTVGSNELTVYINRTKLTLGANEAALTNGTAEFREVNNHAIRLKPNFTKAKDVLWIVRSDSTAAGPNQVANWNIYPPGTNCHSHYGGVRGDNTSSLFFKAYVANPGPPQEPMIGFSNNAYAWGGSQFVNFGPDPVPMNQQERLELTALLTGTKQGLAGVMFSPSIMAGDSYSLHALVEKVPYERNFGWEEPKAKIENKTGTMTVWRLMTVSSSQRLADVGTNGLSPTIGCAPEAAIGGRTYRGDGDNMSMSGMNGMIANAFNEWVIPPPGPGAPLADVHKDVNLGTYRARYSAVAFTGQKAMANNAAIENEFVPYDHYRDQLPPNLAYPNAASNIISAQAAGTQSAAIQTLVNARIVAIAGGADDPLGGGVVAIPVSAHPGVMDYFWWIIGNTDTHAHRILDTITPQILKPSTMQIVRWPKYHQSPIWHDGGGMTTTGMHVQGFCRGNGQSFFMTGEPAPTLFAHEMGHSVHLVHFVAMNFGWKHHHLLTANCMMSYNFPTGFVPQPPGSVGPAGGGATPDTGWPNTVPAVLPGNSSRDPGLSPTGAPTIRLSTGAPANPCAKCLLKLRGWNEIFLPAAWNHPDLF